LLGWVQSLPSNTKVTEAYNLDQAREFRINGSEYLNWGGLNEKWFFGRKDDANTANSTNETAWYYIVPDGSVYQWNGSPRTALTGTLVTTLNPAFYNDLSLLVDAPSSRQYIVDVDAANPGTFRGLHFGNYLLAPELKAPATDEMVENQVDNTLTFNWDAAAGASYDIWISDIAANRLFQYIPDLDGTDIPLVTQLPDRQYRVWIRANSLGVTSEWSDPYEYELYRDAVNIITGGTESNSVDATPTITYQSVAGATSYDVRVLTLAGETAYLAVGAEGTSHRIATPLMFGVDYRVDVRANFADGSRTMWDDKDGAPLEGFGVPLRIDGRPQVSVNGNVVAWNTVPAATSYEIWIDRVDDQGNLLQAKVVYANQIRDTRYEFPIIEAGDYSVWVRAIRAEGGTEYKSFWSPQVDFRFLTIPSQLANSEQPTDLNVQTMLSSLHPNDDGTDAQPVSQSDNVAIPADARQAEPAGHLPSESENVVAAVMAELAESDVLYDSQS